MSRRRKTPLIIKAVQWFKNGDHPKDMCNGKFAEGKVIRYYRHPDVPGDRLCDECGETFYKHGWVDMGDDGHRVCPGDWIIMSVVGELTEDNVIHS